MLNTPPVRTRLLPALLVPLLLVPALPASAADVPPAQPAEIGTALPPGNSGFFSVTGQAQGMASGGRPDQHPRLPVESLTGVIGRSLTMPYQDRGSWVHVVAFTGSAGPAPAPPSAAPVRGRQLPATGAAPPAASAGLLLLGAAWALRRRRPAGGSAD